MLNKHLFRIHISVRRQIYIKLVYILVFKYKYNLCFHTKHIVFKYFCLIYRKLSYIKSHYSIAYKWILIIRQTNLDYKWKIIVNSIKPLIYQFFRFVTLIWNSFVATDCDLRLKRGFGSCLSARLHFQSFIDLVLNCFVSVFSTILNILFVYI